VRCGWGVGRRSARGELGRERAKRALAPDTVDRAAARDGDDPRQRVARDAVVRPALECRRERVLDGLLGDIPVAGGADQGRDGAPEVLAVGALDGQEAARSA